MLLARHLDLAAHELRASGHGHYTICSSGHEANAVIGRLTTPDDPAIVHYRSAALQLERARQVPATDGVRDIALSLVASSDEPASGGRHKAFGGKALGIVPSTSTIASHLPRAFGLALAIERRRKLGLARADERDDGIVVASFGDASLNHSTAIGALNAVSYTLHQRVAVPLLVVCEDNGIGISVRSPDGWVAARLRSLPGVTVFDADGGSLFRTVGAVRAAVQHVRRTRRAAAVHLACVRLLGHAGSDVDTTYRTPAEIEAALSRDPVLLAALELIGAGAASADELLALDAAAEARVQSEAERARRSPRLTTRAAVLAALAASPGPEVMTEARGARATLAGATLAQGIGAALGEALDRYPGALVFGEDVAKKGGVYGVTRGLVARGGPARVFNTLLDEQTILGVALGAAVSGSLRGDEPRRALLPIPEIQYLAYLHNAEDQLRGEACTLPFFSNGALDNPMLVRIAGLGYQKGFGGHFHNDDSVAVLRDVPGCVVCVPARAEDALALYRTALALAVVARRVVVAVEPIALYHTRDLYQEGDGAWLSGEPEAAAEPWRARVYHADARDLVVLTYGNGLYLSLRAARRLERERGLRVRVLDLRWLSPLPIDDVVAHARDVGRVLVVDECRQSGSPSEALAAALLEQAPGVRFARVTAADCLVPLGDAARLVLPDEAEIVEAAAGLVG
ncbi:MAG: MFS transporter [Polyangiaceae bacterium]|nr:MFS transporter [Polyangiaceae bacterium]